MTIKAGPKSFDCVKSMREIRNRISTEIADMSYSELSRWLERQVREDPFFSKIPKSRRPERAADFRKAKGDDAADPREVHRRHEVAPRGAHADLRGDH